MNLNKYWQRFAIFSLAVIFVSHFATWACAQEVGFDQRRLIDREPFDKIILVDKHDNAVLDVFPLTLPDVIDYQQRGELNFVLLKYPERKFKVAWENIKEIKRFDEMVMEEATKALNEGNFDRAFENFLYLYENKSSNNPDEFRERWDDFLSQDGVIAMQDGRYEEALSTFEVLYQRNPTKRVGDNNRSLPDVIGECYDNLIVGFVEKFDYTNARLMLEQIKTTYGKTLESVNTKWENQMRQQAIDILNEAKQHMSDGNGLAAHQAVRRCLLVMPSLPEANDAFNEVIERFPMVLVGTSQSVEQPDPVSIDNWSARRIGRLTQRTLMEYEKPGDEGGIYSFPNGGFNRSDDETGARYRFQISRRASRMGVPDLSTYQLSDRLMDLGDETAPDFYVPWQKVISTVEIIDDTQVGIKMRVAYVKPEAHLQIPYQSLTDTGGQPVLNGLYKPANTEGNSTVFNFNEDIYERLRGRQHPALVENLYEDSSTAVDALVNGEVDVVDRIFPADARRLRRNPDIVVANYILPTIHVLVPNQRSVYMTSNDFRRGLLYAINRKNIVDQVISGGQEEIGYEVVTGPFPRGTDDSDQIAYAYNMQINARPYNMTLGLVLTELVRLQVLKIEQQKQNKKDIEVKFPKLVLAHPNTEVARLSCKLIKKYWSAIGIETELLVLPDGKTRPDHDNYDFVFTEIMMQEPVADIRKVVGRDGWAKDINAPMAQELHNIDLAINWRIANRSLKALHKQLNDDVTVLPLWQVVEKFAYRRNIAGIRRRPVHLYQSVDQWQILPRQSETIPTER